MTFSVLKRLRDDIEPKKTFQPRENQHTPLIICKKGLTKSYAEVFDDFLTIIPHAKKDSKITKKDIDAIPEIGADNNTDIVCLFLTKKIDQYMEICSICNGPTMFFYVEECHSIKNLGFIGNALKGSRPIVLFDNKFDSSVHLQIARELLSHVFEVPYHHKRSMPFIDRVISFIVENDRILLRHYQILNIAEEPELSEIGPRLTLLPTRILEGPYGGKRIWTNDHFVPPHIIRRHSRAEEARSKQSQRDRIAKREKWRDSIPQIIDKTKGLYAAPDSDE